MEYLFSNTKKLIVLPQPDSAAGFSGGYTMHMADALLSPVVGGGMWAVAAGTIAYSSFKVRRELDDRKVPLMGVLGAFLFAAPNAGKNIAARTATMATNASVATSG